MLTYTVVILEKPSTIWHSSFEITLFCLFLNGAVPEMASEYARISISPTASILQTP